MTGVPYPPNPPENPPHPFIPGSPGWLAYERGRAAADSWWRERLTSDETNQAIFDALLNAEWTGSDVVEATADAAADIHRVLLASLLPVPDPETPREEWRVVDGDNVVCRLAGHRDFGTFRPWAEEQCRGLVERFPGESFRIERRVGDEEWEAWCPPDTPMGSCVPRCGDARCEVAAGTDARGKPDGASVPDQTRRIVVYDARHGRGGLDVPVGCTVGEAALLAAEMFGVRVGPNDRPSFGLRGTGLHASDPLPDDDDYELFVIGGTV